MTYANGTKIKKKLMTCKDTRYDLSSQNVIIELYFLFKTKKIC